MIKPVYAFIDSQNVNLSIRSQGWKLDFARFRKYLADKYKVQRAFLFMGMISGYENLYKYLTDSGYEIIFKPTVRERSGEVKGNVDAELVLHCAKIQYDNYDKAIIISGDGDFYCLIEYLEQEDKLRSLIVPNRYKYSVLFKEFRDKIYYMNYLESKVGAKK